MENHTINNNHILNVIRFLVVIFGMFWCETGCKNPMTPEEVAGKFAGTWKLTYSVHKQDSLYIGKAFLVLNKDSTFTCNASFFLRRDSLISQPCSGTWSYFEPSLLQDFVSNGRMQNCFSLKSETITESWSCSGSATDGYLDLSSTEAYGEYRWAITKGK